MIIMPSQLSVLRGSDHIHPMGNRLLMLGVSQFCTWDTSKYIHLSLSFLFFLKYYYFRSQFNWAWSFARLQKDSPKNSCIKSFITTAMGGPSFCSREATCCWAQRWLIRERENLEYSRPQTMKSCRKFWSWKLGDHASESGFRWMRSVFPLSIQDIDTGLGETNNYIGNDFVGMLLFY